ncbi:MAG: IS66 family transposase [Solirubrobacteraceae bacterium]
MGRVEKHEDRLRRLEEQTRQDSRTSSKPPSQDPPKSRQQRRAEAREKAKELARREGERRKAGGQPGHWGAGRELKPSDQMDEIVDHFPDACGACGAQFAQEQQQPGGRFGRHQVAELPPISVIFTEHRTHQLRCRRCRARTSARVPQEIAGSPFGLRLQAALVALTAAYRVPRRGITEIARDLFDVTLSTGAADAICQRASHALAGPHLHLQDWVLDQPAVHIDETGWRTSGDGRALWGASTPDAVFLQIAEHCNREVFDALIGTAFPGIVISDRWNGYNHLDPNQRQVCWSHLQRDFRKHADGLAEQKNFGEQGVPLTKQVFAAWRAYQHEHHDRARLQAEIAPIQTELRQLLEDASAKKARNRWHRGFANNLLKIWPALRTFTLIDGVEPTNNPAERALRAPVIHRKVSLGTQSNDGERFAERALSAAGTCRLQRRSLFTYLSELIAAHNRGDPFPALTS